MDYNRDPNTNKQIYPYNYFDKKYGYIKDEFKTDQFALDEYEKPYYATDENGREYYPKAFGKDEFTNQIRYIKGSDERDQYPTSLDDSNGRRYQTYDKVLKYGKDFMLDEFYAKDSNGHEYPLELEEVNSEGKKVLRQIYAKDHNNVEFYPRTNEDIYYYIRDPQSNEVLAQASNGNQYYRSTDIKKTQFVYPKTSLGEEYYAKRRDEHGKEKEFYRKDRKYPSNNALSVSVKSLKPFFQ